MEELGNMDQQKTIHIAFFWETSFKSSWNQEEMTFLGNFSSCFWDDYVTLSKVKRSPTKWSKSHFESPGLFNLPKKKKDFVGEPTMIETSSSQPPQNSTKKRTICFFRKRPFASGCKSPQPRQHDLCIPGFPCGSVWENISDTSKKTRHGERKTWSPCMFPQIRIPLNGRNGSGCHPSSQCIKHVENSWFWCSTSFPFKPLAYMTAYCVRKREDVVVVVVVVLVVFVPISEPQLKIYLATSIPHSDHQNMYQTHQNTNWRSPWWSLPQFRFQTKLKGLYQRKTGL